MSTIILIIIIFIIVKRVQSMKSNGASARPNVPRPVDDEFMKLLQQRPTTPATSQTNSAVTTISSGYSKPSAKVANEMPKKTDPIDTTQGKSTTQLLNEKAMLDEVEHRKEKRKQEIENERIHGKLHYAQRLWLGDPVPQGKRLVYCAYCNAENLVPIHDYTTKYHCYFCRELL